HLANLRCAQAQRFLAHDMLAGPCRGHGDRPVGVVGCGDHDGVDPVLRAQLFWLGCRPLDVPFRLAPGEDLSLGVADCDQLGAGIQPQPWEVMIGRHRPRTNECDSDRSLHQSRRHGCLLAEFLPLSPAPTILHGNRQARPQSRFRGTSSMASDKPIRVAIIGLGFGAEFIPIYQCYPGAEISAICRRDRKGLEECGERFKIPARYTDYRELLKDPNIDAVHINSPIPDHAWMSIEGLKAGKHVACTVPMGTSIDECRQIVEAQRASGKVYMMMETVVYSREY